MELRPYQEEAVNAVFHEWGSVNSTLIVCATGTGKTVIFSAIAKKFVDSGEKVLILAHRGDLLEQAQDKLMKSFCLESDLEKAESHASLDANIVVASVQTLSREDRLNQYSADHFDAIIIDEAHHAVNDTYKKIIEYFSNAKILGVTATPNRSDLRSISNVFETTAYKYDIDSAIKDGWLSNIVIQRCGLNIDISDVNCVAGDYQSNALGDALEPYLEQIADQLKEKASDRKILVFVPIIAIGDKFTRILNDKGFKAACVSAKSKNRNAIKNAFEGDGLNVVVNCMLWTEGFDNPAVDCIVNLRATRSKSLFRQIIGRGLRLAPEKENCLILDFLWHTSRKGYDVLSPIDLFIDSADIPYTEQFLESEDVIDISELAEMASNARIDAEITLAKRLRQAQNRHFGKRAFRELDNDNVTYLYDSETDNLDTICIDNDPALTFYFGKERWCWSPTNYWQLDPITDKQMEMLDNIGVIQKNLQFKGQASEIINTYLKRKDNGFCSYKQSSALKRRRFVNTEIWSAEAATEMLGTIANNHWKVPYTIKQETYRPKDFYKMAFLYQKLYPKNNISINTQGE